ALGRAFDIAGWAIIAAFAMEYVVNLALAHDRRVYVLNPWRIVDAVIILAPLASLLPFAPEFLRSSPALRVLRLARVLLFGARAHRGLAGDADMGLEEARPTGPLRISWVSPKTNTPQTNEWRELLDWLRRPDERWMHA